MIFDFLREKTDAELAMDLELICQSIMYGWEKKAVNRAIRRLKNSKRWETEIRHEERQKIYANVRNVIFKEEEKDAKEALTNQEIAEKFRKENPTIAGYKSVAILLERLETQDEA